MAEILIVVDAEAKAEIVQGYYGGRAECVVCGWPLFRTSYQPLSAAPSGLLFRFEGLPAGGECIERLRAYLDREIHLVLDSDARTDYLCWQIGGYLAQIGGRPERIKRLMPTSLDREGLDAALRFATPVDERQGLAYYSHLLFDEGLARHLTRLIGSDRGPGNLPLRQASLTALFLLAERERECLLSRPIPKWQVVAELAAGEHRFAVTLAKGLELPADGLLRDEAKARAICDQVASLPFTLEAIYRAVLTIMPPAPYQLAELLHDAKVRLCLAPAVALAMVKRLFEGVVVDGRPMGLISSYSPGTGGPTDRMVMALRRQVAIIHGDSAVGDAPVVAGGMILPLRPDLSGTALVSTLSQEEAGLYDLIRSRALASQMRTAVGETTTLELLAQKKTIFHAHFHDLSEPGFLQGDAEAMAQLHPTCPIPGLQRGEEFSPTVVRCQLVKGEGRVAERYTIETLLNGLAEFSVPADPLTVAMLDTLLRAGYATLSDLGGFSLTTAAAKLVSLLDRAFPRMQGVNLSAYIAQTVTEAVSGRKELSVALKQFEQTLMLHGKILIKAKISTAKLQPRGRSSSTIIKQAAPVVRTNEGKAAEAIIEESALPAVEVPSSEERARAVEPGTEVWEEGEPALEEPSPELMAGEALPEESVAPEGDDEQALPPLTVTSEEEPLPDELKQLFNAALTGTTPTDELEVVVLPPPDTEGLKVPAQSSEGTDQERRCPVCGKLMVRKEDPFGPFWGCSGFPGCRYSEAITPADQGLTCPLCGQGLSRKQTPTGKSFYVCGQIDCQFMSWSKPYYLPCGLCDSPYLVEKTVRGLGRLHCPRAGCPYEQALPGGESASAPPASGSSPKKMLVRRVVKGASTGSATTKKVRVVRRRQG